MQIEEALKSIDNISRIEKVETIGIEDSLGRVLAQDIRSPIDLPLFNKSPLDGFAFKGEDSGPGARLEVVEDVHAGYTAANEIKNGQAIRIMTGAKIPDGANAVCRLESVDIEDGYIILDKEYKPYENYIHQGEEIKEDDLVFKKDDQLNAIKIGTLANLGISKVEVYSLPKIAVISTGSELVAHDQDIEEGKIYNSNSVTLSKRLEELGLELSYSAIISDDLDLLTGEFRKLSKEMDLIISTGGVSVGDADYMPEVLENLETERVFSKVKMKPGGHIICHKNQDCIFLALSGNPFAALASFEIFGRPIISNLSGKDLSLRERRGIMEDRFPKKSRGRRIIRAYYEDRKVYIPQAHESGQIKSAAECNALVDIPGGSEALDIGDEVRVYLL